MAWSVLQSVSATNSGSGNVSATYGTNLSSGSKIVALVTVSCSSTSFIVTSVKDGAGNSLTLLASKISADFGAHVGLYAMDTPAGDVGTKPVITATIGTNFGASIICQEVSGLLAGNTSAMLDGTAAVNTGTASPATGASYSSTASGEYLLIGYGDEGQSVTYTTPGGYTADAHNIPSSNLSDAAIFYKNSTGGAESASITLSGAATWDTIFVAFKLAAAASAAPAPLPFAPGRTWMRRFRHRQSAVPPGAPATVAVTSYTTIAGTVLVQPAGATARTDTVAVESAAVAVPADTAGHRAATAIESAAVIRGADSTGRAGNAQVNAAGQVRTTGSTGRAAGTTAGASGYADPAAATGRTPVLTIAATAVARAAAATGRAAAAALSAPGSLASELTSIGRQVYARLAGTGAVSPANPAGITYRLMDGADGRPGVGSSGTTPPGLTSYSGPFQAGTLFSVTTGGMWLEGYWWWCPAGGDTGAQKFCLWQRTSTSTETLVPDSTVTSGTLTAAAMNYVPLPAPIQLAIGTLYVAATGWTVVNGFPDSNFQFGSGDPYVGGITNGPLVAWSDATAGGTNNWVGPTANWGLSQGVFGTGNAGGAADPTLNFPAGSSNSANFWVDVQVTGTTPSGYDGSYRIWPNKFDAPGTGTDTAANYILGTEFTLGEFCDLDNIWFYSPAAATQLPTQCCIWDVGTETMVPGTLLTSPSWSGAAGSGWVSASYSGVTLTAGDYKVSVWNGNASPSGFNEYTIDYFTTGYGQDGITTGPITVPDATDATSPGQSTYQTNSSSFVYPDQYVATEGQCYWVDVEVTPAGAPPVTSFTTVAGTAVAFPAGPTARGSVSAVTGAPLVLPAGATRRAGAVPLEAAGLVSAAGATGRAGAVKVEAAGALAAADVTNRGDVAKIQAAGLLAPQDSSARADMVKIEAAGVAGPEDATSRHLSTAVESAAVLAPADSTGRAGKVAVAAAASARAEDSTSRSPATTVAAGAVITSGDTTGRGSAVTVAAAGVLTAAGATRRVAAAAVASAGMVAAEIGGLARQIFAWITGTAVATPADSTARTDAVKIESAAAVTPTNATSRTDSAKIASATSVIPADSTGRADTVTVQAAGTAVPADATGRAPSVPVAATGVARTTDATGRTPAVTLAATGAARAAGTTRRLAAATIAAPGTLAGGLGAAARQVYAWITGTGQPAPADATSRDVTATVESAGQATPATSTTRTPAVTIAAAGVARAAAATGRLPAVAVRAAGALTAGVASTLRNAYGRITGTGQPRPADRTARAAGTTVSATTAASPQGAPPPVLRTFVLRASAPFLRWAAGKPVLRWRGDTPSAGWRAGKPFVRWRRGAPRTPGSRRGPLN